MNNKSLNIIPHQNISHVFYIYLIIGFVIKLSLEHFRQPMTSFLLAYISTQKSGPRFQTALGHFVIKKEYFLKALLE